VKCIEMTPTGIPELLLMGVKNRGHKEFMRKLPRVLLGVLGSSHRTLYAMRECT